MPRVYAPVAFRWTDGLDYPFGYFEMPDDSKARAMNTAGKVYSGPGEAAAAAALVSGAGKAVGGAVRLLAHSSNAASAGFSFLLEGQARAPFVGFRPIYINYGAAQTITAAKVAATATALNSGTGLTWANVTFAGASSGSQSAGSGSGQNVVPSILVPDWIMTPSIARSDTVGALPLVQARSYFAGASTQQSLFSNGMGDLYTAVGEEWAGSVSAGDLVSTITTWTPNRTATWVCPVGFEFLYGVPTRTVADVGDSLFAGQESTTVSVGWVPVSKRATALLSSSSTVWQAASYAIRGQNHTASYQTGLEVATQHRPTYLCFRAWSPNDGSPTQALMDAAWARALALIEHCRRLGVTPVLCTTGPRNSLTAGEDALLKAQNARVLSLAGTGAAIVSDEAAVIENPANRAQIRPDYDSGDGLHCVSAGYAAMAQVRAAALQRGY